VSGRRFDSHTGLWGEAVGLTLTGMCLLASVGFIPRLCCACVML